MSDCIAQHSNGLETSERAECCFPSAGRIRENERWARKPTDSRHMIMRTDGSAYGVWNASASVVGVFLCSPNYGIRRLRLTI